MENVSVPASNKREDSPRQPEDVSGEAASKERIAFVCDELKKLHVFCCGMPHEDRQSNPGRGTCPGVSKTSYNLACPHSYGGSVIVDAYEVACQSGISGIAKGLLDEFQRVGIQLDNVDSEGSFLYGVSTGLADLEDQRTQMAIGTLHQLGADTSVVGGGPPAVRAELRRMQQIFAGRLLEIRDEFLVLLESLLDDTQRRVAADGVSEATLLPEGASGRRSDSPKRTVTLA